jgi:hypothetical protein
MLVITHILVYAAVTSNRSQQCEVIKNQCQTPKISRFGGLRRLQHTRVASMRKTRQKAANLSNPYCGNWRYLQLPVVSINNA